MVIANCWYNAPVIPDILATGIKTAIITKVIAIIGAVTLRIASRVLGFKVLTQQSVNYL